MKLEIIETSVADLRKLSADEGKYLLPKDFQQIITNENGLLQKIVPDFARIIFLANGDSEDNYIEKVLPSQEIIDKLIQESEEFNQDIIRRYEEKKRQEMEQQEQEDNIIEGEPIEVTEIINEQGE